MIKLFVIEDHATIIVAGLRNIFRPSRDDIEVENTHILTPTVRFKLTP